jgi:DNA-binding transcriptional MerR regulator
MEMEGFDTASRLRQLIEDNVVEESSLEALANMEGIGYGKRLKTRLNYLVTLQILRQPKAVYHGRGQGGTRLFQRDALDVLRFVHNQMERFTINEIAEIVRERREDLAREACKKLDIKRHIPDPSGFVKSAISGANLHCVFNYNLIVGDVVWLKISELNKLIFQIKGEIEALDYFNNDVGRNFCKQDKVRTSQYIRRKKAHKGKLSDWLNRAITHGEGTIKQIEAEAC